MKTVDRIVGDPVEYGAYVTSKKEIESICLMKYYWINFFLRRKKRNIRQILKLRRVYNINIESTINMNSK